MTSETIWDRIRDRPFTPFRVNTSDGKHYEVLHPEMIVLLKSRVIVTVYDPSDTPGNDLPSRAITISPLHIASLEDIPARVNG